MILGKSLLAAVLAGTIVGNTPTPAPEAQAPAQRANGVTLITGDRVVVADRGHRVDPGPGRQDVGFTSQVRDGHLYVIPSDAQTLVTQGVLDGRLFDVTQLLQWRYGDADTRDIPLIMQSASGPAPALRGAQGTRQLAGLGMTTLRLPKGSAAQTWKEVAGGARALAAGRTKLWLDGRRSFSLDQSVKQIGAPQAWPQGMTGKGVTVAVLDSGYDPDHPDLKDAVAQERNFSDDPDIRDTLGHGTHVASIVAGRDGKYRGVAPEAKLAIGKVGGAAGPTESAILAGMEWAAVEIKAKVVNMSFGDTDGPDLDPLEQAVNTLSERTGTLFVAAAGNDGAGGRVSSPGSAEAALTVGAVDKQGRLADFSSPGPRVSDHAIKPEVTAPGVDIVAAAAAGTADGPHQSLSGTSMASPHVAGAAAILAQRHPEWTGAQLKAALIGSAAPAEGATLYQQGAGLIDLVRALKQQVVAVQGNAWAAFPWNATGERVTTKTITYANASDAPVILDLSAQGEVLNLPADQVTVPAKGEASITLTIDAGGKAPGDYPGTVTARSGEMVVRTLAGAYVELESYDVTLTVLGRQGLPVTPRIGQIYDAKTGTVHSPVFRDGVARVRLPKGDWSLYSDIVEKIDGKFPRTIAVSTLTIDGGDQRLTVDARQGKATTVTLDDPSALLENGYQTGLVHGAWNTWTMAFRADVNSEFFVIPARVPGLTYSLGTKWLSKDVSPSPYIYDLVDQRRDGLPEDPAYNARQKDLAKVTATYRASGVAATGTPLAGLHDPDFPGSTLGPLVGDITLPGTLIHYRTPGLTYESGFEAGTSLMFDGGRLMKRGQTREVWNTAVTGPSFLLPGGNRTGDKLTFSGVGLFADGGAGRTGSDTAATGTATLAKDGQVLATADLAGCSVYEPRGCELRADLPSGRSSYTLTASMRRQVPHSALSTGVESVWTFPSATTAKAQPLPLTAVRYSPEGLDDSNRAKPGSVTRLPVRIERNPGSAPVQATSVRLEMSVDDGANWRKIPVARTGSGWSAMVPNPGTAGFVSLRAVVTDAAGLGLTQTITRAYAVG
ncbi:subtilisin family serine protease [Nonomuraea polychroma]|uniref:Subtilisin family serine protease n=1 Tax=Nonomuraea polychroma TaxID=46176 RepID=A0A438MJS1_9ACTN|nr:S8 family serine peptidase [Nonomuraea polychroma]RVX45786.1 subtilisin family serine protease [Nonomuraea polychroma]